MPRQSQGKAQGEGSCRKGEARFNGLRGVLPVLPAEPTGRLARTPLSHGCTGCSPRQHPSCKEV